MNTDQEIHRRDAEAQRSAEFRCLTLLQPWASFVMWGFKTWETRSRNIGIPLGPLLIHASKQVDPAGEQVFYKVFAHVNLSHPTVFPAWEKLPRAGILGHVYVTSTMIGDDLVPAGLTELEKLVGDFTPGRYFARLEKPVQFAKPIPIRGYQGIWKVRITI